MKPRNLALWPLFNKPRPEEELWAEVKQDWNQEEEHFRNGFQENFEGPREKVERLAPNFGDLKRLVL
ncbi:MAG: hypothetical protein KF799_15300 [Bdellovibrionales bacterium]|nr:hypothetical protein [Bdellovibrionales bacterium]